MIRDGSCRMRQDGAAGRWASSRLARYAGLAAGCLAESLWPTRCVGCNAAGEVLCAGCRSALSYVDQWMACPVCGAPFGRIQCTECNSYSRRCMPEWNLGRGALPFAQCVSAVRFDDLSARIVRGYKDAGEQRLARFMAFSMACALPPAWLAPDACVARIPSTRAAVSRRGFDHAQILQEHLAALLGLPARTLLEPGRVRDQRGLGRFERFANMRGCFRPLAQPGCSCTGSVILADDVYTTGATLMSAAETLLEQGFREVRCVTFSRVY